MKALILSLAVALFSVLASCTTQEQWAASGQSFRVEVGTSDGSLDSNFNQKRDAQVESTWIAGSWAPFEWWHLKAQAEANARAMTDALYRAKCEEEARQRAKAEAEGETKGDSK